MDHFKYHGAFCSANETNVKELNSWTGRASAAFRELDKVWRDLNINLDIKMKFYNACVLSTLLYAWECWTLTERDEARLDAFNMCYQHKILRVVGSQHITNSSIRSRSKQPQLTIIIRKCHHLCLAIFREWTWTVSPRSCTSGNHPTENKRPGQPKTSWHEVM